MHSFSVLCAEWLDASIFISIESSSHSVHTTVNRSAGQVLHAQYNEQNITSWNGTERNGTKRNGTEHNVIKLMHVHVSRGFFERFL